MRTLNFSARVNDIFSAMDTSYDEMNSLMQDLALGREIYDAETDRVISKAEANARVLDFSRQILGITDIKDRTAVRRAFRDNAREWFDIIEDTVEVVIEAGFTSSMWFNNLVETKTIAYDDRQDFYVENDALLSVAKAGTSHHDHIMQRIGAGQPITIPTDLYVIKVGADINKYVVGQVDWAKLVAKIADAYVAQIQSVVYSAVRNAASSLPVQTTDFIGTGPIVKTDLDNIIENVSAANGGAPVVLMGTKAALANLTALVPVNWIADEQKSNFANTGLIGIYEGNILVEVPQRFTDRTLTTKIFPSNVIMVMPQLDDKFVKLVDEGDTQILEKNERGDYQSDLQSYEVQRRFGVGVVIGRQFGQWTI